VTSTSKRLFSVVAAAAVSVGTASVAQPTASSAAAAVRAGAHQEAAAPSAPAELPRPSGRIEVPALSSGARIWFQGLASAEPELPQRAPTVVRFGDNVDANDPQQDLVPGQSETAIAAAGRTVVVGWNDASGFVVGPTTKRRASLTAVGVSTDGGRTFRDLLGLPNDNPNQQWLGDPTIAAIDAHHFAIGSLYLPSAFADCSRPQRLALALEILTVPSEGGPTLGPPVRIASGGDLCTLANDDPSDDQPNIAFLDKPWMSYDGVSRTLAVSYTRFFFGLAGQSGRGRIDVVRAHVPTDPRALSSADWERPVLVWGEEDTKVNQGAYVSVAPGGDAYVTWERNVQPFSLGDPYSYIHVARVRPGDRPPVVGGRSRPRVASLGQRNSSPRGGVKSLGLVGIVGYNRGIGQDFPRIAVNPRFHEVVLVWNDASVHPLGDIWLRALPMDLGLQGRIRKVNDDSSSALHFLPAVSVRRDGSTSVSWYDRRLSGPQGSATDYFGEVRASPEDQGRDFRITTGSTDWLRTSALAIPNFGDYTDNASSGDTTYYTWSDGRLGVPQPFVASRGAP
jgi:hypothetical protein